MQPNENNDQTKIQRYREHLLNNIMKSAHDAVVLMDEEGKIIEWNPAAERIFGYSRQDAIGSDLHELVCQKSERLLFREAFPDFLKTGTGPAVGKIVEMMAKDKQGRLVPIELSLSAFNSEGKWHSMGIVRDITERKAAEETLRIAKDEAEKASAARASFVANMSHELRTPLHGMIGMQSLLERTELDGEQTECLQYMKDASEKLLHLVDDLLDMNKLEKGVKQLNEEFFYYGEELYNTMESFAKMASIKGLSWQFDNELGRKVKVRGDREKLVRAACHLITNALKFTATGTITLKAELKSIYEDIGIFSFTVSDTGIGIEEKDQSYLFDQFYQKDTSTTRLYDGAGVGLQLVKRFVEIMGGNVQVTSQVGVGSSFTLEMPLKIIEIDQELTEKFQTVSKSDGKGIFQQGIKILIAEDDQATRVLMRKILKTFGIEADIVENGLDAINYYTSRKYDLVIMDIQMPIMDGFETVQMIREYEKESKSRTPVVALTAYVSEQDHAMCLNYGMDDVLTKPVDLEQIYEMIRKWTK